MADPSTLTSLALISNPNSRVNKKGGLKRIQAVADEYGIPHKVFNDPKELESALRNLAGSNPDILVVNGGDGTIDMVLTALSRHKIFPSPPVFALLRGGTTNMTHGDIGLRQKPETALRRLCEGWRPALAKRRPITVKKDSRGLLSGFFLGVNAVPRAIRMTRHHFHKKGMTGALGQILSLGRVLFGGAGREILKPIPLRWRINDGRWQNSRVQLATVTSLQRLILGIEPLPSKKEAMSFYMADDRAKGGLRLIRSFFTDKSVPGITKKAVHSVTFQGQFLWTLDGEIYETQSNKGRIQINPGPEISFLTDRGS